MNADEIELLQGNLEGMHKIAARLKLSREGLASLMPLTEATLLTLDPDRQVQVDA